MMNEIPYRFEMMFNFFGERKCFSDQSGNSLSHRIVEAFHMICLSTFFSDRTVSFEKENLFISRPKIRLTDSALPINTGQGKKRLHNLCCLYIRRQFLSYQYLLPAISIPCCLCSRQRTTVHLMQWSGGISAWLSRSLPSEFFHILY